MTSETILLIGRDTRNATEVLETHARRLGRRTAVEGVETATYEEDPIRELGPQFEGIDAETVYAVPMATAHTHDTTTDVPAALSYVPGEVHYCEPPGQSPAVTEVIERRGAALLPAAEDTSLILVGFGSSSKPYHRQTTDYHAARLREQSAYGEVLTCFLLQNPAVECVRYNVSNERAVAVPLFLTRTQATEDRIPAQLELPRGGIEYADPLGADPRITDAVHAEIEKRRTLDRDPDAPEATFEDQLTRTRHPVATDGDGTPR